MPDTIRDLWFRQIRRTDQEVERVVQAIDAEIANRYNMGPSLCHTRVHFRARLRAEINLILIQMPERDYWKRP